MEGSLPASHAPFLPSHGGPSTWERSQLRETQNQRWEDLITTDPVGFTASCLFGYVSQTSSMLNLTWTQFQNSTQSLGDIPPPSSYQHLQHHPSFLEPEAKSTSWSRAQMIRIISSPSALGKCRGAVQVWRVGQRRHWQRSASRAEETQGRVLPLRDRLQRLLPEISCLVSEFWLQCLVAGAQLLSCLSLSDLTYIFGWLGATTDQCDPD